MMQTRYFTLLAFFSLCGYSQVKDSLPQKAVAYAADKFPFTRLLNAESRYDAPYDISPALKSGSLPGGRVAQLYQSRISANVNFIKSKQWILSTGLLYNFIHSETEGGGIGQETQAHDMHFFATGLNLTHFTRMFGRMAVLTAGIIPTGGSDGFERVTGMFSANLVLKADGKTKMTVGLLGIADPGSVVPVVPTFAYERRLESGWIVDIMLPRSVFMKKDVFKEGRVSLGTQLDATNFYLKGFNGSRNTFMFSQMELLSGVTYEHCFLKGFIATLKTGYKYIPSSRIAHINNRFNDYVYKADGSGTFYANIGISYNP
ncbi:hypothetical protein [uncultured Flavobacterium sp.]|uniref:hypothetical protein n=1 Tax=uncultured Flavobacterium sp. TaxID=165435 RepID=UPI0025E1333D|nr:hypothetical protein [uncultured Flavobacterium sp.]